MQRIRLSLPNGHYLSIIQGRGAHATNTTVEAALVSPDGRVYEPAGYLDVAALVKFIHKAKRKART